MARGTPLTPFADEHSSRWPTFAAGVIVLWILGEIALRWGGVLAIGDAVGSLLGADMVLVGLGFPALAWGIARWGRSRGIEPRDWEYDATTGSLLAGVGGVVGYFVLFLGAVLAYDALVGLPASVDPVPGMGIADEPLWAVAALLVVNSIVVPIAEELAWRGVVQTALMSAYGTLVGSTLTAIAFVLKHVVVDAGAAPVRLLSLVILAAVLCGLRAKYGTASSTVAHLGANAIVTSSLVFV